MGRIAGHNLLDHKRSYFRTQHRPSRN